MFAGERSENALDTPVPPTCENGKDIPVEFMNFGGHLIHITSSANTFQSNQKYCQSLGGDVFIPKTKDELQQLATMNSKFEAQNLSLMVGDVLKS